MLLRQSCGLTEPDIEPTMVVVTRRVLVMMESDSKLGVLQAQSHSALERDWGLN